MYAPQSPLYVGEGPYYEDAYYGSPMRDPYYSAGRPVYDVPPVDYRYRDVPPVIYEEPPVMYQEPPLMLRRYEPSLQGRPKVPKLYVAKISANCLGPWLLLKEIGVPFELVEVDILNGDNHTREFLAMNPMGQVPTYAETDGTVIWESNAIMRFICDRHHVPKHYYPKYESVASSIPAVPCPVVGTALVSHMVAACCTGMRRQHARSLFVVLASPWNCKDMRRRLCCSPEPLLG